MLKRATPAIDAVVTTMRTATVAGGPHDVPKTTEVTAQVEEIRQGLADGSISTGVDPVTGLPL